MSGNATTGTNDIPQEAAVRAWMRSMRSKYPNYESLAAGAAGQFQNAGSPDQVSQSLQTWAKQVFEDKEPAVGVPAGGATSAQLLRERTNGGKPSEVKDGVKPKGRGWEKVAKADDALPPDPPLRLASHLWREMREGIRDGQEVTAADVESAAADDPDETFRTAYARYCDKISGVKYSPDQLAGLSEISGDQHAGNISGIQLANTVIAHMINLQWNRIQQTHDMIDNGEGEDADVDKLAKSEPEQDAVWEWMADYLGEHPRIDSDELAEAAIKAKKSVAGSAHEMAATVISDLAEEDPDNEDLQYDHCDDCGKTVHSDHAGIDSTGDAVYCDDCAENHDMADNGENGEADDSDSDDPDPMDTELNRRKNWKSAGVTDLRKAMTRRIAFNLAGGMPVKAAITDAMQKNAANIPAGQEQWWATMGLGIAENQIAKIARRRDVTPADKERAGQEAHAFADPKNKKYKLDTPGQVRSAKSYINAPKNRGKYSPKDATAIENRITAAGKKKGIKWDPKKAAWATTLRKGNGALEDALNAEDRANVEDWLSKNLPEYMDTTSGDADAIARACMGDLGLDEDNPSVLDAVDAMANDAVDKWNAQPENKEDENKATRPTLRKVGANRRSMRPDEDAADTAEPGDDDMSAMAEANKIKSKADQLQTAVASFVTDWGAAGLGENETGSVTTILRRVAGQLKDVASELDSWDTEDYSEDADKTTAVSDELNKRKPRTRAEVLRAKRLKGGGRKSALRVRGAKTTQLGKAESAKGEAYWNGGDGPFATEDDPEAEGQKVYAAINDSSDGRRAYFVANDDHGDSGFVVYADSEDAANEEAMNYDAEKHPNAHPVIDPPEDEEADPMGDYGEDINGEIRDFRGWPHMIYKLPSLNKRTSGYRQPSRADDIEDAAPASLRKNRRAVEGRLFGERPAVDADAVAAAVEKRLAPALDAAKKAAAQSDDINKRLEFIERQPANGGPMLRPQQSPVTINKAQQELNLLQEEVMETGRKAATETDPLIKRGYIQDELKARAALEAAKRKLGVA